MRLWLHEASRVYGDKFIDDKDMSNFHKLKFDIAKQSFEVGKQIVCNVYRLSYIFNRILIMKL